MRGQTNNPKLLCDIISQKAQSGSKKDIFEELEKVDQQLCKLYSKEYDRASISNQLNSVPYSPKTLMNSTMAFSLGIPKTNSLTDSMLRTTLGCEEKLAKSYIEILKETQLSDEEERQRKKEIAKKKFSQSNPYSSSQANSKPLMDNIAKVYLSKKKPVIDNEHDAYLKTQLIYMQKMKNGYRIEEKDYYDKHMDKTTKKISEIGGIEDTISYMEESLRKNQMKNVENRSYLTTGQQFYQTGGISARSRQKDKRNNWVDRSKAVREALVTSMTID